MEKTWRSVCFSGLIVLHLLVAGNAEGGKPITAAFVFGDSYADTGNHARTAIAWQPPYGISFPGKPSGRHSDGRVLTDFVASYFKVTPPVPYSQRDSHADQVSHGMNFASGGTGIFDTVPGLPNATAQIDQLQEMRNNNVYSASNFASSLVLFSVSGNDYGFYVQRKGSDEGLTDFVELVVKQLSADLERLYGMGFRRFAVTDMGPLGCLPLYTAGTEYKRCNDTANAIAVYHNTLLQSAVKGIRKSRPDASFVILDQYADSLSILKHPNKYGKFTEPLKPCCMGACGVRDVTGKAMYSVCEHPDAAFFWDMVHPTQAAWQALMGPFGSSLHLLQT